MAKHKYPKHCPVCNTTKIQVVEDVGMKCLKCGYINKRKI